MESAHDFAKSLQLLSSNSNTYAFSRTDVKWKQAKSSARIIVQVVNTTPVRTQVSSSVMQRLTPARFPTTRPERKSRFHAEAERQKQGMKSYLLSNS